MVMTNEDGKSDAEISQKKRGENWSYSSVG